ncbi:hypothetical protein [Nannocystis pusilla]|uniref:hypothetical protein n=1 Tax=Nannocystis pusilla TaxID=889268 RepID=UPI003DA668B7
MVTFPASSITSMLSGNVSHTRTSPFLRCSKVNVSAAGSSASIAANSGISGFVASKRATWSGVRVKLSSGTWQVAQERPLVLWKASLKSGSTLTVGSLLVPQALVVSSAMAPSAAREE